MKRIINGKMYNTATATLVGEHQYLNFNDVDYESEELYLKKTGEWFLYGEGGPFSKYGEQCGSNNWCDGEVIKPLTKEAARKWLENHDCTDAYIEYFGEPEE
jgi:hypothetical protein